MAITDSLRQMFTVILDNAVKFSPEKESVEIRVFGERDEKAYFNPGFRKRNFARKIFRIFLSGFTEAAEKKTLREQGWAWQSQRRSQSGIR